MQQEQLVDVPRIVFLDWDLQCTSWTCVPVFGMSGSSSFQTVPLFVVYVVLRRWEGGAGHHLPKSK